MNILYIVIYYFFAVLIWSTISLIAYASSIAFKKPMIIIAINGFSQFVAQAVLFILTFILGFSIINSLIHNTIIDIIVLIIFGSIIFGLLSVPLGILAFPFMFIPSYLMVRLDKDTQEEDIEIAEILDENGKVIGRTVEGSGKVNRNLSIYFLIDYALIELYVYLHRNLPQYQGWKWGDYITEPLFWIGSELIVFGILLIFFYLIKYRKVFPFGKRKFVLKIIKIDIIITAILIVLSLL